MCDMGHGHHNHDRKGFGFLVDTPEIRALIDETRRITKTIPADVDRVAALRPAFAALLAADGWLPEACARPDDASRMGGGNTPCIVQRTDRCACFRSWCRPVPRRLFTTTWRGALWVSIVAFRTKPSISVSTMVAILRGLNSRLQSARR